MHPRDPKTGSLASVGLQRFMDEGYYKYGGYIKLVAILDAGGNNVDVGRAFTPEGRHQVNRQRPRAWRARWELEKKYPQLRNGGTIEDIPEEER